MNLTLAQMRRSLGRLTAAGIAIVISTAFIAATLLATDMLKRAAYDSVTQRFGQADLVFNGENGYDSSAGVTIDQLARIREINGVTAADGASEATIELARKGRTVYQNVIAVRSSPTLQPLVVAEGRMPEADDEIALPPDAMTLLGVSLGETITQTRYREVLPAETTRYDPTQYILEPYELQLTVVGIVDDPYDAFALSGGAAVIPDPAFIDLLNAWSTPIGATFWTVGIVLDPGANEDQVRTDILAVTDGDPTALQTRAEVGADLVDDLTNGYQVFAMAVLSFVVVAMVVAALVVSNTFQVLVAQRTRTLALLRCVGASKLQLRRSVLLEGATLGLIASSVGVALGVILVQIAVLVLREVDLAVPIARTVAVTPASVCWPILVGVAVTVGAALVPAAAATRVSPLEAMRPAETANRAGASAVRAVLSAIAFGGGAILMALAVVLLTGAGDVVPALAVGIIGAVASFAGILVSAVFWIPWVVTGFGNLLGRTGPSAQLAVANTSRNPRRTAATSTALIIGVTLVTMMTVGAATARNSVDSTLDGVYNVDVVATTQTWTPDLDIRYLTPPVLDKISAVWGVEAVAPVQLVSTKIDHSWTEVSADPTDQSSTAPGEALPTSIDGQVWSEFNVMILDPDQAAAVLRVPSVLDRLDSTTLLVSPDLTNHFGFIDGETVTVNGPDGSIGLMVVVEPELREMRLIVDKVAGAALVAPETPASTAWIRLAEAVDTAEAVNGIKTALDQTDAYVTGPAVQRAAREQVVDTILAVTVGLLAIAVIIALIGVANTLSLSILERRRESATLRAIGLSKRQLRFSLAVEGLIIAGVAATLGIGFGILYGWFGSFLILSSFAEIHLTIPLRDLSLVLVVALLAGLLASVLPAHTATRTSPVAALANE